MNPNLEEILKKSNFNYVNFKKIAKELFSLKKQQLGLTGIRLIFNKNPLRSSGSIGFTGNLDNIKLHINLYKIFFKKEVRIKKLFDLYNNFTHELEHVKSFQKTKEEDYYDYEHLLVLLEYLSYAQKFNINVSKREINVFSKHLIAKIIGINYLISTSEIKSRLISYQETLCEFYPYLNEEDIKLYEDIIKSLKFLNDNIEIMYDENRRPVNKFLTIIQGAQTLILKNKELLQEFGILKNLFNENGIIKNVYELYININDSNREMYNKIMINLLLSINIDLGAYFDDESFKKYIEQLIDQYNNKAIQYFKNMELGEVFVNRDSIIDNLRMRKQNVSLLNKLSNVYGLEKSSGTILGL